MRAAHFTGLALATAALGMGSAPAFAAVMPTASASASASISNVFIQVIDLDLADDIDAAVTFDSPWAYAQGYASSVVNGNWTSLGSDWDSGDGSTNLSADFAYGSGSATASTTAGDLFTQGSGPGATASASLSDANMYVSGYGQLLSSNFTLTPMTLLVLSATPGALSASAALGASASAYAQVSLEAQDGSERSYGYAYRNVSDNGYSSGNEPSFLKASFTNLTDIEVNGYAYAHASAYAHGIQAAVPEPGTYALFIAGLAAVGGVVSRRTRR